MRKGNILLLLMLCVALITNASTFTSKVTGNWGAVSTWSVTGGADADGIPDSGDDVIIKTGHTVTLNSTNNAFKTLVVQLSATLKLNSKSLDSYGDFTNLGTLNGSFLYYNVRAATTFSSTSLVTNAGTWQVYSNFTVAAGTSIKKTSGFVLNNSAIMTNNGSINITVGSITTNNTSQYVNSDNSYLQLAAKFLGTRNLSFSAPGNTVSCSGACNQIPGTTYYNLNLLALSTKTALGAVTVLNDLYWDSNTSNTLDMNRFVLTVGGNWTNTANTTVKNQSTIIFNGSRTQVVKRSGAIEYIDYFEINNSGSVQLKTQTQVNESFFIRNGTLELLTNAASALRIKKNFTNDGTLITNVDGVLFNGAVTQTLTGISDSFFYDLTLNNTNGLKINSPQSITNRLKITNGTLASGGNVTLISSSLNTARILSQANASCKITGNMTIQKHIGDRGKGWHNLTSPVIGTTINDWDNEIYMSGIGPYDGIVGPEGVDGNSPGFNSVITYNEPTATWNTITGSSTSVISGKGYQIWLADDETNWYEKVINTIGVPTFGSKTVKLSYTSGAGAYAGLNLIGNPMACPVSFSLCTRTNIGGNILILDNSGNYNDYGSNPIIPAHQGFWVGATAANAQIIFKESAKVDVAGSTFYRTAPDFGVKLVFSSPNLPFYNENSINFERKATFGFDNEIDALYIMSPNNNAPSMFMNVGNDAKLITNNINSNEDEVTIPLGFYTPTEGSYNITPTVLSMDDYKYAWIENIKTGKKYDLTKSIVITGKQEDYNYDYVLRLSKKSQESEINQSVFENDLTVFNTENNLNIKSYNSSHTINQITIFDLSGKVVFERQNVSIVQGETSQVDITELPSGLYIANIIDNSGNTITKKFIK